MLKILGIPAAIAVLVIVFFPLIVAGTFDPCEATARIAVGKAAPDLNLEEPWKTLALEAAIKVNAASARNHGIVACYRLIPVAMNSHYDSANHKLVRN